MIAYRGCSASGTEPGGRGVAGASGRLRWRPIGGMRMRGMIVNDGANDGYLRSSAFIRVHLCFKSLLSARSNVARNVGPNLAPGTSALRQHEIGSGIGSRLRLPRDSTQSSQSGAQSFAEKQLPGFAGERAPRSRCLSADCTTKCTAILPAPAPGGSRPAGLFKHAGARNRLADCVNILAEKRTRILHPVAHNRIKR